MDDLCLQNTTPLLVYKRRKEKTTESIFKTVNIEYRMENLKTSVGGKGKKKKRSGKNRVKVTKDINKGQKESYP